MATALLLSGSNLQWFPLQRDPLRHFAEAGAAQILDHLWILDPLQMLNFKLRSLRVHMLQLLTRGNGGKLEQNVRKSFVSLWGPGAGHTERL